jgi:cytochrome c553
MSHRLILRVAVGLAVFLGLAVLAFAWSAGVHDERLDASMASAGGAPQGNDESAKQPSGAQAFDNRCARCHSTDEVASWTSKQSGNQCDALFKWLQKHDRAPEPDNRVIALKFAPGCTGGSQAPH